MRKEPTVAVKQACNKLYVTVCVYVRVCLCVYVCYVPPRVSEVLTDSLVMSLCLLNRAVYRYTCCSESNQKDASDMIQSKKQDTATDLETLQQELFAVLAQGYFLTITCWLINNCITFFAIIGSKRQ